MGNCFSEEGHAAATAAGGAGPRTGGADGSADHFFKSRGLRSPFTQIELSLSASNLCDPDVIPKCDPLAVVYAKQKDGKLEEIGRTEVILSTVNPAWIGKVIINYEFEVLQHLVFQVYDIDPQFHNVPEKVLKLEEQQLLGEASCFLPEVITKPTRSLMLNLDLKENNETHLRKLGKLSVHAEECLGSKTISEIVFRCSELENKDLFSKSDPFLLISRIEENGTLIPICKTEVKKNDRNPMWRSVIVNLQQVISQENPLAIECFNFNSHGKHDLVGKVVKSLAELEKLHQSQNGENLLLPAVSDNDNQDKVLKSQIFVERFHQRQSKTFLDYISDGCELNLMVAIDFTASNGNPRLPDSLHYIDPSGRPNAYQRAILDAGEVLQHYNEYRRFPAWGFGARPIDGPVSHCFNLNGSTYQPEVEGIQGIMSAYISALRNVSLAGPTLFGHVINAAALIAGQSLNNSRQKYFVLLIVTDGVITDLQETKDALVKASDLPLSILIVGVGGADFKEMEILDAEKGERIESSTGRVASRDIVQFVAMRDVLSGEVSVIQSLLAELPGQFMSYIKSRDIDEPN
ncbi:protein BONZAI 2-like isoform X1 [Canna indica]|uniref:Protein BONZAI 2-like isoform X1 n=1 Tax=Canna indica TaxID=4628 RepID=A0AAQ3KQ35_9LILI|nr:protein BONZAI 2-like isoform X1 [Canna indica]